MSPRSMASGRRACSPSPGALSGPVLATGSMLAGGVMLLPLAAAEPPTSLPTAGAIGSLYNVAADPRLNHEVRVTHGVLADESTALLQAFFADRR